MECRICKNKHNNKPLVLKEMMFGFRDEFEYFQCAACGCIQITDLPGNMSRYYPGDYYSYRPKGPLKRANFFKRLQCRSIVHGRSSIADKLITYNYAPPAYYFLLKDLQLTDRSAAVLDIGCGSGELLKDFYAAGYKNLTGIDPYIKNDLIYNQYLRILKKDIFSISGKYNAIMLHHSLEHMENQAGVLKKIYALLDPKGIVLIRIPVVSSRLMNKYGTNLVSLDPPRHFYIHSLKSISLLVEQAGFTITNRHYDAHEFSYWASEQYTNDISLHNDPESFLVKKTFCNEQIARWRNDIAMLNKSGESDNLAIYLRKK